MKTIKHDEAEITNSADIANAFNTYFSTIGDNLANNIPNSDVNPISYINPVNSSFSFAEINVETVIKTLKSINPNKATGPDNIPCVIANRLVHCSEYNHDKELYSLKLTLALYSSLSILG